MRLRGQSGSQPCPASLTCCLRRDSSYYLFQLSVGETEGFVSGGDEKAFSADYSSYRKEALRQKRGHRTSGVIWLGLLCEKRNIFHFSIHSKTHTRKTCRSEAGTVDPDVSLSEAQGNLLQWELSYKTQVGGNKVIKNYEHKSKFLTSFTSLSLLLCETAHYRLIGGKMNCTGGRN